MVPNAARRVSYERYYLELLVKHKLDAFLYDFPFAQSELKNFKLGDSLRIVQYGLTDATYNVGLAQGAWSLTRDINLAIRDLRASQRYVDLVQRYLGGALAISDVPPGARTTLVQAGDTLRSVAKRELGDEERWGEIWALNRSRLGNQNLLVVGAPILLPHE